MNMQTSAEKVWWNPSLSKPACHFVQSIKNRDINPKSIERQRPLSGPKYFYNISIPTPGVSGNTM